MAIMKENNYIVESEIVPLMRIGWWNFLRLNWLYKVCNWGLHITLSFLFSFHTLMKTLKDYNTTKENLNIDSKWQQKLLNCFQVNVIVYNADCHHLPPLYAKYIRVCRYTIEKFKRKGKLLFKKFVGGSP